MGMGLLSGVRSILAWSYGSRTWKATELGSGWMVRFSLVIGGEYVFRGFREYKARPLVRRNPRGKKEESSWAGEGLKGYQIKRHIMSKVAQLFPGRSNPEPGLACQIVDHKRTNPTYPQPQRYLSYR